VRRLRQRRSSTSSRTPCRRPGPAAVCTTCCRVAQASCRHRSDCSTPSHASAACTRCSTCVSSPSCDTYDLTSSIGFRYHPVSRSTLNTDELPPPTPRDNYALPVTHVAVRTGRVPVFVSSLSRLSCKTAGTLSGCFGVTYISFH